MKNTGYLSLLLVFMLAACQSEQVTPQNATTNLNSDHVATKPRKHESRHTNFHSNDASFQSGVAGAMGDALLRHNDAGRNRSMGERGHYHVLWRVEAEAITLNNYFDLEVEVVEPLKSINYPVELEVEAGMAVHNHGMHSRPVIERLDKQRFRVRGMLFHMPGEWQIRFGISRGVVRDEAIAGVML